MPLSFFMQSVLFEKGAGKLSESVGFGQFPRIIFYCLYPYFALVSRSTVIFSKNASKDIEPRFDSKRESFCIFWQKIGKNEEKFGFFY